MLARICRTPPLLAPLRRRSTPVGHRVPLALLIAVVYLVGAATGGSLFALLRRSYEESRRSLIGSC